jgi:hypothetical protein
MGKLYLYNADAKGHLERFMKKFVLVITTACMLVLSSLSVAEDLLDYSKTIAIFKSSPLVQEYFDKSYGYALYPSVGKGAFVLGFAYGKGQVYRRSYVTGTSTLKHYSIGFQGGGKVFSEIIFFQDQRSYEEFIQGNFEFDAQAAVVAVTAGASARAGSTGNTTSVSTGPTLASQSGRYYVKGLAVFVQAKGGLLLAAALGLQQFTYTPLAAAPTQ